MLHISLFGAPHVEQNGQPLALTRSKALALLAYLALTRQPQQREGLLALLWPEFDGPSARNNLRRELSLLKSALGEQPLVVDRAQVCWNEGSSRLDVAVFQAQLARVAAHAHPSGELCAECAVALTAATQLQRSDLLASFVLPDAPAFDEWLFFQREELRQQLAGALESLTGWYSTTGEHEAATTSARRWLALDPLHEPAQRALLRAYALAGQHTAALRQFEESARLLQTELQVAPEAETLGLYEAIKARRFPPASAVRVTVVESAPAATRLVQQRPVPPPQQPIAQNLPRTNGFVGRQRELADITRRLTDPFCRLLTLTGPGGVGKTRLALQVAQLVADEWAGDAAIADGVLFVPLAAVNTASGLVSALATAARFDFYPDVPPQQQVLRYFSTKHMLVVLDNFEQLLEEANFVADLLAAAPGLRLLVTSREALNLHEEWFHPIDGLSFPNAGEQITGVAQLSRFDAVRLFEQHARRVRSDFALCRERAQVVRLCRLVEGMPLALELAASWLKALSVDQVVAALERDLDILTTKGRDTPARHRSMRAVLEESWRLLAAQEQQTLAQLAVFQGGFSAAAAATMGAPLPLLSTLVEKSLLRVVADSRFQLHELLRQFAAEKLSDVAEASARQRHSHYYLTLLASNEELSKDSENMVAAWHWAVAQRDITALEQALDPLFALYQHRGRYHEGFATLRDTAASLFGVTAHAAQFAGERLRVQLLARQGVLSYLLGNASDARCYLEQSLQAAQAQALHSEQAFALVMLGHVALGLGDYATAQQQLLASLEISRPLGDKRQIAAALEKLAEVLNSAGERRAAKHMALESLAISRGFGDASGTAYALDRLGYITFCLGEYSEATAYYRAGLDTFEALGLQYGRALTLGALGMVQWAQGATQADEARACYEQSLALFRTIGHQLHIVERLINLSHLASDVGEYAQAEQYAREGVLAARQLGTPLYESICLGCLGRAIGERGDFQHAREYLVEALQIAAAAQIPLAVVHQLFYAAALLIRESHQPENSEQALELLQIVIQHPSTWHAYVTRARQLSDELQRDMLPAQAAAAIVRGQQLDWQAGASALLEEWSLVMC